MGMAALQSNLTSAGGESRGAAGGAAAGAVIGGGPGAAIGDIAGGTGIVPVSRVKIIGGEGAPERKKLR